MNKSSFVYASDEQLPVMLSWDFNGANGSTLYTEAELREMRVSDQDWFYALELLWVVHNPLLDANLNIGFAIENEFQNKKSERILWMAA